MSPRATLTTTNTNTNTMTTANATKKLVKAGFTVTEIRSGYYHCSRPRGTLTPTPNKRKTPMKTNLGTLAGQTPLYTQYAGQYQPQDAYVEIHADGKVYYESNAEIGNAVPVSVWHGRIRRVSIPNHLTSTGYQQLHDYISAELETLITGMDETWDGSNWVGTLTEEARKTLDQLEQASAMGEWEGFDSDEQALAELTAD